MKVTANTVRYGTALRIAAGVLSLCLAGASTSASAQSDAAPGEVQAAAHSGPPDPFDRGTPRSSVYGFIVAGRDGDFARATEYLDLSGVPEAERAALGRRLARQLKVVLDRTLWVDFELVSDSPEGFRDDGLPARRDRLGTIDSERGPVDVLLARIRREDGVRIWKFAAPTVGNIPALYDEFGYGVIGDRLPAFFFDVQFLDAELWQWLGLMLALVAAYALAVLSASVTLRGLKPLVERSRTQLDDDVLQSMFGPLRLVLLAFFFFLATVPLGLSVGAQQSLADAEQALVIIAIAWLSVRLIEVFGGRAERVLAERRRSAARGLVPIGRRVVKAIVWVLALLGVLQNLGFEVTGLIAGLGVGGLAVALAAQKYLENLFGAVMLATDEPVGIGDFCKFGDRVGTVEEIGLRSTRIRTLSRTVVSVPNAAFASLHLENYAKRDMMWLKVILGVRYETTSDQLRFLLAELRRMLLAHPKVAPDPVRARFVEFGAYSLDIEVYAYVTTTDWNEFLAVREDIFLRIMDIVERSGTGFAFPSQTIYAGADDGLDDAKSRAAEAQIRAWREQSALPFPDFAAAEKAQLDDTLAYPPEGSAVRDEA